jgi:3-hydroxyisobutyrate dehydrogenase
MRAGFIGLGAMGASMARNLHRAGLLTGVWNRTAGRATELAAELQVSAAPDPATLAASCDVLVSCVSADADLLAVLDALLPGVRPGLLLIDCSTVASATARECAARLAARGGRFLDCPVSGGVEGARLGTLAIMAGGSTTDFDAALPVLRAMGKTITRFGEVGAGQAAKATNQILCAGYIRAIAEAMSFARAEGLPLTDLIDTLGKGAGSSWYFVHRAPNMVGHAYPAGFRVRLHHKDLGICRAMAAEHGATLSVVEALLRDYDELMRDGHGDEDISAVHRLTERLFD